MYWNKRMARMQTHTTKYIFRTLVCGGVIVFGLSACNTAPKTPFGLPGDQHKITVAQKQEDLRLALAPNMAALTPAQIRTLTAYAAAYLDHGYGPLVISVPEGANTSLAARRAAQQTQKTLHEGGVDWAVIVKGRYQAAGTTGSPLLLSFTRYVASAEGCGGRWRNLVTHPGNNESDNFGCALAANTAAMIADPYDLVRPSTVQPALTARRQTVMGKYIVGQPTGAERSSDAKGTVSDAVN
jgi:pilus assembly protein CpaD